jgi:hypothetical protein
MKHLLAFFLICYAFNANCQTDNPIKKGNIVLGGSSGVTFSKSNIRHKVFDFVSEQYYYQNNDQKSFTVSFNPLFGYFIVDGLVIGISPSYSYSQLKYTSYDDGITNSIGIAPFIKYYFNNGFFSSLGVGYSFSTLKEQGLEYKYSSLSYNPGVGYAFFISSKVSIEPSLEYFFSKSNYIDDTPYFKTKRFLFSVGFQIFL